MALECQCRGELALRHRGCAIKWTRVKGDNICDICKAPITNLPQVSPRAPTERSDGDASMFEDADERAAHMLHGGSSTPLPLHIVKQSQLLYISKHTGYICLPPGASTRLLLGAQAGLPCTFMLLVCCVKTLDTPAPPGGRELGRPSVGRLSLRWTSKRPLASMQEDGAHSHDSRQMVSHCLESQL